jgi:hypothetical protein
MRPRPYLVPGLVAHLCLFAVIQANAQGTIVHPNSENLKAPANVIRVSRSDTVSGSAALDALARRLRLARPVDSIGTLDGALGTVLGTVDDVALDSAGRVLVLDMAFRMIRAFTPSGKPEFTVGGAGDGPVEFRTPIALWAAPDGAIVVVDVVHGAKWIALDRQRRPTLARRLPLVGAARGACVIADQLVIISPAMAPASGSVRAEETILRVYALSSGQHRSFGEPYRTTNPIVRLILSEGVVGCADDGTIITALSWLPFVHGYRRDGSLMWTAQLVDFQNGRTLERNDARGRPTVGLDPEDPRSSFTRKMTQLGGGFHAVQVGLITKETLRDGSLYTSVDTYVFETRTGKAVFVSSRLPLLGAAKGTSLYGFVNNPFPRVQVLRIPN